MKSQLVAHGRRAHILPTFFFNRHRKRTVNEVYNGGVLATRGPLRCTDPPQMEQVSPVGERGLLMHTPKGPDGLWKTGQRVPVSGLWLDQYGVITYHALGATFPPCIDRKGECAYRDLVEEEMVAA